MAFDRSSSRGAASVPARRGLRRSPARLLLLLCASSLAILPAIGPHATAAQAPSSLHRDPSISRAWIEVMGRGLHVVVTDPQGRVESIADTGASRIPNFSMDSIPIHDRPGAPRIYCTHILLEPEQGEYIIRVVSPESRMVYLDTRRWLMADCGALDSLAVAAHDTALWSIEYSPPAQSSRGPCWIRIGRPRAPVVPQGKRPRPR